jgi:hypothetical protein
MRGRIAICAGVLAATGALADELAIEGSPKVYTGANGERVTVLRLRPRSAGKVLLSFEGTDTALDGKILAHEVTESGNKADLKRIEKGRDYVRLTARETWWSSQQFSLYLEPNRDVPIRYDEKKSEGVDAAKLLNAYLGRRAEAGEKAQLVAGDEKKVKEAADAANTACGSKLTARIEWGSLADDALKKWDVGKGCAASLRAIAGVCDDSTGKEAVNAGIKEVVCKLGKAPGLTIAKGVATWTTAPDAVEQEELATRTLLEKL